MSTNAFVLPFALSTCGFACAMASPGTCVHALLAFAPTELCTASGNVSSPEVLMPLPRSGYTWTAHYTTPCALANIPSLLTSFPRSCPSGRMRLRSFPLCVISCERGCGGSHRAREEGRVQGEAMSGFRNAALRQRQCARSRTNQNKAVAMTEPC